MTLTHEDVLQFVDKAFGQVRTRAWSQAELVTPIVAAAISTAAAIRKMKLVVEVRLRDEDELPPRGIRGALEDVDKFHRATQDPIVQDIADGPPALTRRVSRWRMLKEEFEELEKAMMENDLHAVADAYADIIYIALGSAIMHIGKDRFVRVWDEVQRANMDKFPEGAGPLRREDGKILKPEGWRGPDIEKAFKAKP